MDVHTHRRPVDRPVRGRMYRRVAIAMTAVALALPTAFASSSAATPRVAPITNVIAKWDAITMRTVVLQGAAASLDLGLVSAAMYNAVVTIEGGYEQYLEQEPGKAHASPEAAAAAAAHKVLRFYYPAAAEALDADYAASIAAIPNGVGKVHGERVGRQAAKVVLDSREGDGRNAAITPLPVGDDPGEWRGTPPNPESAPMLFPWLGFTRPLMLNSPTQIPLDGPDPVGSAAYADDLAEAESIGRSDSTTRGAAGTRNAWFYSDNVLRQYSDGRALLIAQQGLDIVETARMYAIWNMSTADAGIECWRSKYDYAFWRPVTAIQTTTDSSWNPLITTPMYPDYLSGHACFSGAASASLDYLFPDGFDLTLTTAVPGASPTVPPTPTVRHYTNTADLDTDTMNARIQLGIHFRKAMTDGNALGQDVVEYAVEHYFQPVD